MINIKFTPSISMTLLNNTYDGKVYRGQWNKEMDREYIGEYTDNQCISVSSRLISHPKFGKIEHATINIHSDNHFIFGSTKVGTELIQYIKDRIFGENRFAIQVYPKAKNLVDMANVYHIFVFDKLKKDPFVINESSLEKDRESQIFIELPNNGLYSTIATSYNTTVNILGKSYDVDLLKFELPDEERSPWNAKYNILGHMYSDDIFAIEDYPFNKDYRKRYKGELKNEPGRLIVFKDGCDMPFGIAPDEYQLTKYINRGAYKLTEGELIECKRLLEKYF